ncbi:MAG TPA: 50S ribosomal protein L15 [Candidatus Binatia bacterium]|nr:50S ribosomal protein L15 [Candidatus Binatia bacterium]
MDLSNLRPADGASRPRKRVGRGPGSGHGKTAGRGHKGRGSRSGGNTPPGYEGGQMPLQRRVPKRGFRPVSRVAWGIVNVGQLAAAFPAGSAVGPEELRRAGLVRGGRPVKCLADGTLTHALTVRAHAFSAKAKERIAAAGGTAEVIGA